MIFNILLQDWTWRLLVSQPSWLRQNSSCFECWRLLESDFTTCSTWLLIWPLQLHSNYPLRSLFDPWFCLQTFSPMLWIKMYPKVYLPQNAFIWPLWPLPWIFYWYLQIALCLLLPYPWWTQPCPYCPCSPPSFAQLSFPSPPCPSQESINFES